MALRNPSSGVATFLALFISWSIIAPAASSIPCSSASSSSNIFSSCDSSSDANNIRRPPWNPSIHINNHGYLKQLFRRIPAEILETTTVDDNNNDSNNCSLLSTPVVVRQVPGDGDCLFHSLAIALSFTEKGQLMRLDTQQGLQELKEASRKLRRMAVECLASSSCTTTKQQKRRKTSLTKKRYKRLFIQGSDSMKTSQLLSTASSQYGITPEQYCELMMQDSYWGGGPEIVALCAVLRRPIHVYELVPLLGEDDDYEGEKRSDDSDNNGVQQTTQQQQQQRKKNTMYNKDRTNNQFCLRLLATFGSPKFDSKEPLHILSADSRFPDVDPHCALKDGNHFLAMFPVDKMRACLRDCYINGGGCNTEGKRTMSDRKQRVRGGDSSTIIGKDDGVVMEADDIDDAAGLKWLFHGEWYDDLPCDIPVRCELDNTPGREGKRCWFSLRNRREIPSKKEKEEEEHLMSVYRPKSMKRFIGYWINVFVRIFAYCGDMI